MVGGLIVEPDPSLLQALIEKLEHHEESVPVYAIRERPLREIEAQTLDAARRFCGLHGLGEMRYERRRGRSRTMFRFQENIGASVFHASGTVLLDAHFSPMQAIIAADAEGVDEKTLRRLSDEAREQLEIQPETSHEALHFERLWRLKATGITKDGKRGPIALTRVVGAYRRYIGRFPVLGRASVFVEVAAEGQVAAAGIDWRPLVEKPIDETPVLSPEDGAVRVLAELQRFDRERQFTRDDYKPQFFALGYFSLPKRSHQAVMQPTYVAMFGPTGPIQSVGRVIVVPAAPNAYEPIARPQAVPPGTERAAREAE
jgi:hypothetical protein